MSRVTAATTCVRHSCRQRSLLRPASAVPVLRRERRSVRAHVSVAYSALRPPLVRGFASSSASAAALRSAAEPLDGGVGRHPTQALKGGIPAGRIDPPPASPRSSSPSSFSSNVTADVLAKVGRRLHLQASHPLSLIRQRVVEYFSRTFPTPSSAFAVYDSLHPQVSVQQNFDDLLVPPQHPSRRMTDTVSRAAAQPIICCPAPALTPSAAPTLLSRSSIWTRRRVSGRTRRPIRRRSDCGRPFPSLSFPRRGGAAVAHFSLSSLPPLSCVPAVSA